MSYQGNPLSTSFSSRIKQDFVSPSGTSFTMNQAVSDPNDISLYINHVRQEPGIAYTVDGTTALTTTGTLVSADDMYVIYDELTIQTAEHPEGQALRCSSATINSVTINSGDDKLYIGHSADQAYDASFTPVVQIAQVGNTVFGGLGLSHYSNDAEGAILVMGSGRATSVTGTTIVADGDTLGRIEFQGQDGGDFETGASIFGEVDGTPGANDMPGRLVFKTTADSAHSASERMRINNAGQVLINQTNPAYAVADADNLIIGEYSSSANNGITIVGGATSGNGSIYFSDATSGNARFAGYIYYNHQYDELVFGGSDGDCVGRFSGDHNLVNHGGFFKQTSSTVSGGQFYNGTNITGYNGANFSEFNSSVGNEFICSFKAWDSGTDQEGIFVGHAADTSNDNSHFFECQNSAGVKVKVNGNGHFATAPGTYGSISDERIKKDIKDASDQWDDIKELKFKKYKLYNSDDEYMGLVAQEVEKVCPSLVYDETPSVQDIAHNSEFGTLYEEDDDIPKGRKVGDTKEVKSKLKVMKYSILYMKAVKALQEAMTRIETLEAKVKTLEDA